MPLLVACSSTIRTNELESDLKAVGFDEFIEAPVSNEKISDLLNKLKQKEYQQN